MKINRKSAGFTLIELMIVVAIVAILASIAYPSYQSSVRKSKRADGKAALLKLELAQEKWRANNPAFTETLGTGGLGLASTSPDGYYNITITTGSGSAVAYTAKAAGVGDQANDTQDGDNCGTLTLAVSASGASRYGAATTDTACW